MNTNGNNGCGTGCAGCLLIPVLFVVAAVISGLSSRSSAPERQFAVATVKPSVPVVSPTPGNELVDASPAPRATLVQVSPTPDPWDSPEFKKLLKPQTAAQKKQEKEDAKHRHDTGTEFSDIAAGERPEKSAWDGIVGGGRTKDAIKSVVSDPDSVKLESSTDPWIGHGPGGACWVFKVVFRCRNGFGGYIRSVAWVYWRNYEVIDCKIE